jgi:hypothetical protein
MSALTLIIDRVRKQGFHNHRLEGHAGILRDGIVNDLASCCSRFEYDLSNGVVARWENVRDPAAQDRNLNLVIAEADRDVGPNIGKLRIWIKNKSVITAHRGALSRFADLYATLQVLQGLKSEAIAVATVIVGVAGRVLNVPDKLKPLYRNKPGKFESEVLPRLSSGDQSLWREFEWAVSTNAPEDPQKTIRKFRELPTRRPGRTHVVGYDYVLLVPAFIDNVNQPFLPRAGDPKSFGIDVEHDYADMIKVICKAYRARWHL